MQPAPQNIQLMSKHRVLSFKPQLRLEWRGQDGQSETEQPDHSASLGDSITSSTRIGFSVHTGPHVANRSPDTRPELRCFSTNAFPIGLCKAFSRASRNRSARFPPPKSGETTL